MKRIINLLSMVVILTTINTANAQKIDFETTTIDFGTILETDGKVTREFAFTNTGDKPLVISNVIASCGCTTPGWTREPVLPGQKGYVKATYDTKGRVAPFNKNLTVTTNGQPNRVKLIITGVVLDAPIDINKAYPQAIGELRLKEIKDINFAEINSASGTSSQILEVANPSETKSIKIEFQGVPKHITVRAEPESLEPRQQGVIRFSIDGTARTKFGYENNEIKIKVGGATKTIKVASIVRENITASDKDSQGILTSKVVDGGVATPGKPLTAKIEIKNNGHSNLIIKRISTDNTLFTIDTKKLPIVKPGETSILSFTAKKPHAGVNKTEVYIETNSPYNNSLLSCTIVGKVE